MRAAVYLQRVAFLRSALARGGDDDGGAARGEGRGYRQTSATASASDAFKVAASQA